MSHARPDCEKAGKEQVSLFVCTEGNDIIKNKRLELERFAKRRCVSGEAALYVSPRFFGKAMGLLFRLSGIFLRQQKGKMAYDPKLRRNRQ